MLHLFGLVYQSLRRFGWLYSVWLSSPSFDQYLSPFHHTSLQSFLEPSSWVLGTAGMRSYSFAAAPWASSFTKTCRDNAFAVRFEEWWATRGCSFIKGGNHPSQGLIRVHHVWTNPQWLLEFFLSVRAYFQTGWLLWFARRHTAKLLNHSAGLAKV